MDVYESNGFESEHEDEAEEEDGMREDAVQGDEEVAESSPSSDEDSDEEVVVESGKEYEDAEEGDTDPMFNVNAQDGNLVAELKALEEAEKRAEEEKVAEAKKLAAEEMQDLSDDADEEVQIKKGPGRKTNNSWAAEDDDFEAYNLSEESSDHSSDVEYEVKPKRKKSKPRTITKRKRKLSDSGDFDSEVDTDDWDSSPRRNPKKRSNAALKPVQIKLKKHVLNSKSQDSDADYEPGGAIGRTGRKLQNLAQEHFEQSEKAADHTDEESLEDEIQTRKKKPFDIMAPVEQELLIEKVLDYRSNKRDDGEELEEAEVDDPFEFLPSESSFMIKWHRLSYRQCSWHTLSELSMFKGYKKVTNFIKRVEETLEYLDRNEIGPDEREDYLMAREQVQEAVQTYQKLERIISDRRNAEGALEYLAKWSDLSYAECTWEAPNSLNTEEDLAKIDDFLDRNSDAHGAAGSFNPFSHRESRKPFRRIVEQPEYLSYGNDGRKLRDYQLEGLNFLAYSWVNDRNVILADEMGLGKTLQTICCIGWLAKVKKVQSPFLVVVPLSTIAAWHREFSRWLPSLNVIVYVGDGNSRDVIRRFEFVTDRNNAKFHVLLTTPELVLADMDYLVSEFRWSLIAVDEAHRLKNEESSMHKALSAFTSANRLLITGTPLQNSIRELWALLNFLNPSTYVSAQSFEEKYSFSELRNAERIAQLHAELRPYILRRQKEDVEKSLPSKTYAVLRVGLTSLQQKYYKWILTRNFSKLNAVRKGSGPSNATSLQNIVVELKKICNHPYLFPNVEDMENPDQLNALIRSSGKLILLDKLLLRLKEKGHRVLVFSQMVRMLDILQDYCRMRGFAWQRLDGSMGNEIRQKSVDHFNAPDSTDFVFLLSTRAGGLGINLATADTVVIFDSDWNPQNDLQAESRAHRIGQKKDVKVFRLLSRDTVEEDILERAKRKRVLEHLVIHGVEGGDAPGKMTFKKEELSAILRFGAERLFEKEKQDNEENEKAGEKQQEKAPAMDDIDEILERAPKEQDENEAAAAGSVGDSLLNAFKWADFATEDYEEEAPATVKTQLSEAEAAAKKLQERENALQQLADEAEQNEEKDKEQLAKESDMDFWNRVIPQEEQDEAVAENLNYLGPRRITKTKKYTEESPTAKRKPPSSRRRTKVANGVATADNRLSKKDSAALIRSFKKFGSSARIEEILADANLTEKIAREEAAEILDKGLSDAKKVTADKGTVVISGETVAAKEVVRRAVELGELARRISEYENDIRFRLPRGLSGGRQSGWLPSNDAMMLVGIHRHGYGNWEAIGSDEELKLADKIASTSRKSVAARATKLLGELVRDASRKSSKGKRGKMSSRSTRSTKKPPSWEEELSGQKEVLLELRELSEGNKEGEDRKVKIRRTRECLVSIGNEIERSKRNPVHGWRYVAAACKTALKGPELASLYSKLRKAKSKAS
ncbi:hypothetical protein NDN08_007973 [Rhodosorus marinus]|uniref:Uncharacterized protein n=1 Tax=Rhodosorus marinus TaxID=101924 RepID=A0AAV8V0P4_9RHOD|nr:hypothetical protein NDN08_007973 [Rhodosorus marinus]